MHWWAWLILAVAVGGAVVTLVLLYRLREVRRAGTPVLLRRLPAGNDEGWRHGTVHYTDNALLYYRLSSLRPGPTEDISRRRMEVTGRRKPTGTELEIMDGDWTIVDLKVAEGVRTSRDPGSFREFEIAMEPVVATAFLSWYEARSPSRSRRRRPA
ncbi:MAG: DUF2550 domain-containing protein [Gordonia sp. (in: high G+C Gram-positive bacteria)]|uniref:DUF2550 domain-containing protein n=1 Tax=Gordonia sp. (in: high G+C Gram-positive bacteria) TaxID=84139 RepID=UPI0039E6B885